MAETPDVTRLREIQQELSAEWIARDRATIERLIAPDWAATPPSSPGARTPAARSRARRSRFGCGSPLCSCDGAISGRRSRRTPP